MAKQKKLEDMRLDDIIAHLNKLRNMLSYSRSKGFDQMSVQLELELEKTQNRYETLLAQEAMEYEERKLERMRRKGHKIEEDDPYIVFSTSEGDRDDDD